jgi:hypothetical protein
MLATKIRLEAGRVILPRKSETGGGNMHIRELKVGAGRTFNCPGQPYSNEKPTVEFSAALCEGDDPLKVATELRAMAEQFVEDWKRHRLRQPQPQPEVTKRAKTEPKASQDPRLRQPLVPRPAFAKPAKEGAR